MTTESHHTGQEPALAPDKARQGLISGRVVTVLIVSLVLALVAMPVAYLVVR